MRIVQDSDDELDDDVEVQPLSAEKPPMKNTSQQSHGTGSTESLKRAIQDTHRAHLQSQPSQNEPASSVSLPEHPTKKRKISSDHYSHYSPDLSLAKTQGSIAYGQGSSSKSPFSSLFRGGLDSQVANAALGNGSRPPTEAAWNLQGPLGDSYALHDPHAMFPEPSSTVPNATLTQQRLLEVVDPPRMLGLDSDYDSARPRQMLPPEPSIPWSDDLKLTPINASASTSASSNQGGEQGRREATASQLGLATPMAIPHEDHEVLVTQRTRRGSSARPRVSPLSDIAPEDDDSRGPVGQSNIDDVGNEAAEKASLMPESSSNAQDKARHATSMLLLQVVSDHNSDDDLAIGLPLEQYKPRPSRSRSHRVYLQEPIDYSVIPEKAKRMSKRRKTTDAPGSANTTTTPQKVQQICDMGFTPSTTKSALKQNGGDVTRTIDWLVSYGIGEDELAAHTSPRRTASRGTQQKPTMDPQVLQSSTRDLKGHRKEVTEVRQSINAAGLATDGSIDLIHLNEIKEDTTIDTAVELTPAKSPKVQVVIPAKSPKSVSATGTVVGSSKKAKRRKTTLDQPEPEANGDGSIVPEIIVQNKRARGRPKKAAEATKSTETTEELPSHDMQTTKPHEVSQALELNRLPKDLSDSNAYIPSDLQPPESRSSRDETVPPKLSLPNTTPTTTSQTPERSTKTAGGSAVDRGKVPYRVGLSKRARIAPLLRVLKK